MPIFIVSRSVTEALKLLTAILAITEYVNAETLTHNDSDSRNSSEARTEKEDVHGKDGSDDILLRIILHKKETNHPETSTFVDSSRTMSDRFENRNFNPRSLFRGMPSFRTVGKTARAFRYSPEKRAGFFLEPFYPASDPRNYGNNSSESVSIYHPHLHRKYWEDKFVEGNWEKLMTNNRDDDLSRGHIFYPFERSHATKKVTLNSKLSPDHPDSVTTFRYSEAPVKGRYHESKRKRHDGTILEVLGSQTISDSDLERLKNKNFSSTKPDGNESAPSLENSTDHAQKERFEKLEGDVPTTHSLKEESNENATDGEMREVRFERSDPDSDSGERALSLLSSNRVYYEKIPLRSNLSWYVYVNCSRDKCRLTNNTSESELVEQGWILHNCTSYGCSEMYPRTESVQKFIGLMLLVLSLCVLKIVVFLLVFYYCRRIQLTGHPDERKRLVEEEEEPRTSFETDRKSAAKLSARNVEASQREDVVDRTRVEKGPRPTPIEARELDSKIWMPPPSPVLEASPCLLAAGDPYPHSKKEVTIFEKYPKPKRRRASRIPRLEKRAKNEVGISGSREPESENNFCTLCYSPDKKKEELLLLDLDDEICTENVHSRGKSPDWESWVEDGL